MNRLRTTLFTMFKFVLEKDVIFVARDKKKYFSEALCG